jgi:S-DNA-T family DNA segregation ATPase FtsK/SpoIIIE
MIHSVPNAYRTPGGRVYSLYSNLADLPHLLIAGATGSGKSVALNGIIYAILATRSPFNAQFVMIDPKKVELVQYASLPHTARYASEPSDMIDALTWTLQETDRRFSVMQRDRIREYNGPDLYVIIDELADLMTTQKKEALPLLQRLAQIGRAAHVHLLCCTQTVLAAVIPTVFRCNIPAILGLRTGTAAQSRLLISVPGCETLPDPKRAGRGFGFLRDGADLARCELYMYPDAELQTLIDYWTSPACQAV